MLALQSLPAAVAYFTEDTVNRLRTVDDIPQLANLSVPHGQYKSARSAKGRPDHIFNSEAESAFARLEYVPYAPRASPPEPSPTTLYHHDTWSDPSVREPITGRSNALSSKSDDHRNHREVLVPLSYLQDHTPPRRDPTDERVLMLLTSRGLGDKLIRSNSLSPRIEG